MTELADIWLAVDLGRWVMEGEPPGAGWGIIFALGLWGTMVFSLGVLLGLYLCE